MPRACCQMPNQAFLKSLLGGTVQLAIRMHINVHMCSLLVVRCCKPRFRLLPVHVSPCQSCHFIFFHPGRLQRSNEESSTINAWAPDADALPVVYSESSHILRHFFLATKCIIMLCGQHPLPITTVHRRLQRKARPPAQRPVDKRPQDTCTCNSVSIITYYNIGQLSTF